MEADLGPRACLAQFVGGSTTHHTLGTVTGAGRWGDEYVDRARRRVARGGDSLAVDGAVVGDECDALAAQRTRQVREEDLEARLHQPGTIAYSSHLQLEMLQEWACR